ncbi:prolipoprotein diacylglyceryl transferase, partial [bacterium]|nr:prolipoprotein diacylglyceryl transferase [bacterium]
MFTSPGSIAFSIGSVDIHFYGIIMSLSMLSALFAVFFLRKKFFPDIEEEHIYNLAFVLIIFGLLSARLYYVLLDKEYFLYNPFDIIAIWKGGISIQGAIIGGIVAGFFYTKKHNINFFRCADLITFGLITGQIIGRWGNFFNSEAFGLPTNLPWKLFIPYYMRPEQFKDIEFFHPTFLYESLLNILVLAILFIILKKQGESRKNGVVFCSYLILYSIVRIFVEAIRTDSVLNIGGIHIAQIASVI